MEILEVLQQIDTRQAEFTVNTGVSFVQLAYPIDPLSGIMSDEVGLYYVAAGDNFQILSLGYVLPMGFELYNSTDITTGLDCLPKITIYGLDRLGNVILLDRSFVIPFANYELNSGKFYSGISQDMKMVMKIDTNCYISMIGVPAALNGIKFKMPVFAKLIHNTFLVA